MNNRILAFLFMLLVLLAMVSCSDDDDCEPDSAIDVASSELSETGSDSHLVYTDIVVNISAADLWTVLTDFDNMPNWSSSFQGLTGDIRDGGEVTVTYIFPDPTTGEPTESQFTRTLIYTEGERFGWSAPSVTFPGIVDNHIFRVEAISDCQSRFIQTDEFQGTNPIFSTEDLGNAALPSYNQFNAELKAEGEN